MQSTTATVADTILSLERGALDRWGQGDPWGVLEVCAANVTYFDPITPSRLDGFQAFENYLRPVAGKISITRYDIVNPQVVVDGTIALLTYNLVNYTRDERGVESVGSRWNSTEVYQRVGDAWKVIHSHWSFTKHPAFEQMSLELTEAPQA